MASTFFIYNSIRSFRHKLIIGALVIIQIEDEGKHTHCCYKCYCYHILFLNNTSFSLASANCLLS